jgi:mannose/fructose/N-acetylgalactosamine-specific phosphotransferase system component IIB
MARMSVELFRIDDRFVHGQVVVGWGQPLEIGFIVLVDDDVAASDWEQELYRMGVPADVEIYFDSVASAAEHLPAYLADRRHGIVLTGTIAAMRALADNSGRVARVNVGGIHHRAGRSERLRYVFLSPDEARQLAQMAAAGVEVFAQDVPTAPEVPLTAFIGSPPP